MYGVEKPEVLADFPIVIQLPIQWGDMDAYGHVNNTVPIRWFESARIAYLERTEMGQLLESAKLGPILASITCNYRRQLHYPDTILVGARVSRIGRSSLTMEHAAYSCNLEAVGAEGSSVIVVFNYETHRPTRMPDEARIAAEKLEGRSLSAND